jgi:hypothetical protein
LSGLNELLAVAAGTSQPALQLLYELRAQLTLLLAQRAALRLAALAAAAADHHCWLLLLWRLLVEG